MKIRTITCHDHANYGASLQAFALQQYLSKQGHDVKIIDYLPQYIKTYDIWRLYPSSKLYTLAKRFHIIHAIYALHRYIQIRPTMGRIKAFEAFKNKYLHLTDHYQSFLELANNPPEADIYIAGSDQIWNTNLENGKDASYFLQFGTEKTKRISYAASFGIESITSGLEFQIKSYLKRLDSISVRETSGVTILNQLNISGCQVVDPVFLLSNQEWMQSFNIEKNKKHITKPYILVYELFGGDKRISNTAQIIAKEKKLQIVAINDLYKKKYADINITDGSPVDFVNLISNAEFVIADSFHATAFSIIFHKPFLIYYNKNNISRMKDLLSGLNLLKHLNSPTIYYDINWSEVDLLLQNSIIKSKTYLSEHLK